MTRSTLTDSATATAAVSAAASAGEDGGPEARRRARQAWEQRVAAADATIAAFVATVADPLPPLPALRLAIAARCQGTAALAAGEPVAGLGPGLLRRLRRAAARWMRWRPPSAPDPAGELLRRATAAPGIELGELVRGFAVTTAEVRRRARAEQPTRLDVAHRRAQRQRAAILAAWPDWLKRDGDQLVLDPGGRFLQVHRLPSPAELATPALRRWLRAVTALQWYAPAAAVELTDPDGRYVYVPLDAGRLALDGDRTRGPWTSHQPRLQHARQRARRAIEERRRRRGR